MTCHLIQRLATMCWSYTGDNAMGYKIYYKQNIDGVSTEQSIDTFDNIYRLNPLNSPWTSAGCYAGATPANGSEIGTYSVASWSGWSEDPAMADMRDASVRAVSGDTTQNLRFMVRFNSDISYSVGRQSFKWTGIVPERAEQIAEQIETNLNTAHYTVYSPYTRSDIQIALNGSANSPLLNAPLTSLKINQLVFLPFFIFKEREYYNYNEQMGGYQNTSSGTSYTKLWSAIKPEDKTASGSEFDSELFDNGWKEIPAINPDGRRFIHCVGVALQPFYGKSSYRLNNGAYVQSTNPDDGKVYGNREQFGNPLTPQDESPSIINNYFRAPYLYVITENYDNNAEGVYYSTPTGIYFTHHVTSASDPYFNSYSVASNFQKLGAGISWNPAIYASNNNTNNVYRDFKSGDKMSSDLSIYSDVLENDIVISPIYNITDAYTGVIFYPQNNGQAYSFGKSARTVNPVLDHIYPIKNLWATIASLGCYVASDLETAQKAQTGFYAGDNTRLYLGHMSENGVTDGIMLQGKEVQSSVQAGIDDIIQNTPYTPVIPKPEEESGGGVDDNDKGTGTNLPAFGLKLAGSGGFMSYFLLGMSGLTALAAALATTAQSFWAALGTATDFRTSNLLQYISSLKWYPIDILSGNQGLYADVDTADITFGFDSNAKLPLGTSIKKLGTTIRVYSMGSVQIPYKLGHETFLDKDPYSTVQVWLPFCGMYPVKSDFVVGNTIAFYYVIDLVTGMCTALVTNSQQTLLNVSGKIGVDYAVTGNDIITQSERMAGAYVNSALSAISGGINLGTSIASENAIGAVTASAGLLGDIAKSSIDIASAKRAVPVAVSAGSGFGSSFAPNTPCVIVNPPAIRLPEDYGHAQGYVYNQTVSIGAVSGFTVCDNPDLSGIPATSAELDMIRSILTSGFYA